MDTTEQITFDALELEYTLNYLIKKRQSLYLKGLNDEKINDNIRAIQHKLQIANCKSGIV
jgi:hypothetical protein